MRDNGAVIIRGEVLGVEHREGTSAKGQPYAFDTVSVLTGKAVNDVMWRDSEDLGPVPREGDKLNLEVELGTYAGRLQIDALRHVTSAGLRSASTTAPAV